MVVGGGTCRTHSALIDHLELVIYQRAKTSEAGTWPLPKPWQAASIVSVCRRLEVTEAGSPLALAPSFWLIQERGLF